MSAAAERPRRAVLAGTRELNCRAGQPSSWDRRRTYRCQANRPGLFVQQERLLRATKHGADGAAIAAEVGRRVEVKAPVEALSLLYPCRRSRCCSDRMPSASNLRHRDMPRLAPPLYRPPGDSTCSSFRHGLRLAATPVQALTPVPPALGFFDCLRWTWNALIPLRSFASTGCVRCQRTIALPSASSATPLKALSSYHTARVAASPGLDRPAALLCRRPRAADFLSL